MMKLLLLAFAMVGFQVEGECAHPLRLLLVHRGFATEYARGPPVFELVVGDRMAPEYELGDKYMVEERTISDFSKHCQAMFVCNVQFGYGASEIMRTNAIRSQKDRNRVAAIGGVKAIPLSGELPEQLVCRPDLWKTVMDRIVIVMGVDNWEHPELEPFDWRLSGVLKPELHERASLAFAAPKEFRLVGSDVGLALGLTDLSRVVGHPPRVHQGQQDGYSTDHANYQGDRGKVHDRICCPRYVLLGAKVLTSIIVLSAFTIIWMRLGGSIRPDRKWDPVFVLVWVIIWTVFILAGATWAVV